MKETLKGNKGFTLIELIIVIVILGILAAVALPKFANLQKDAKISAVQGMAGAMNGAAVTVHAKALITDNTTNGDKVTLEGKTITVYTGGFPNETDDGILNAITISASNYLTADGADNNATDNASICYTKDSGKCDGSNNDIKCKAYYGTVPNGYDVGVLTSACN